ncbi:hypothetical protein NPIL_12091 [Nephila pilipes]|uniref:Uncharacterized protein n=1 Tax=Nephila pilipes TaxID=299642 RepID=A0A8X6USC1_NEPPI|nr:hypothetical protein NPIL_12091 [Nephila pilipes]
MKLSLILQLPDIYQKIPRCLMAYNFHTNLAVLILKNQKSFSESASMCWHYFCVCVPAFLYYEWPLESPAAQFLTHPRNSWILVTVTEFQSRFDGEPPFNFLSPCPLYPRRGRA